jgi:hypothetical protein
MLLKLFTISTGAYYIKGRQKKHKENYNCALYLLFSNIREMLFHVRNAYIIIT